MRHWWDTLIVFNLIAVYLRYYTTNLGWTVNNYIKLINLIGSFQGQLFQSIVPDCVLNDLACSGNNKTKYNCSYLFSANTQLNWNQLRPGRARFPALSTSNIYVWSSDCITELFPGCGHTDAFGWLQSFVNCSASNLFVLSSEFFNKERTILQFHMHKLITKPFMDALLRLVTPSGHASPTLTDGWTCLVRSNWGVRPKKEGPRQFTKEQ